MIDFNRASPILMCCLFLATLANLQGISPPSPASNISATKVMSALNRIRRGAGLLPLRRNAKLSESCFAHAEFIANHGQESILTEADADSEGGDFIVIEGPSPERAAVYAGSTFFHRIRLLDPGLLDIGLGWSAYGEGRWIVVLRLSIKRMGYGSKQVLSPGKGEKGVALHYGIPAQGLKETGTVTSDGDTSGTEQSGIEGSAGYPIILSFFGGQLPDELEIALYRPDGSKVPAWLSSPDLPILDQALQRNSYCLIPKSPLEPQTRYTVILTGSLNRKVYLRRSWFITGPGE